MPSFIVDGGHRLAGTVRPAGNKNAALPMLAATLLADGPVTLHNLPRIRDVETMIELLDAQGVDVWVYRGADWFVRDAQGPHVARERWTVKFDPTPVDSFAPVSDGVAKVVGVSDDYDAVQRAVDAVREQFGDHVSAAKSQPYYGDVTHPDANKGAVARYLARVYGIPAAEIATIGDSANDVLMFAHSGLSIAMGNASPEVQRAARRVTTSNEDEGFANAVERYVLP